MALFGGARDISLFRKISREFTDRIVQQEIGYYKIDLDVTSHNIYGESPEKFYYKPIKLFCLIEREDSTTTYDDSTPDYNQNKKFRFLRDYLREKNLAVEPGDVILWDNRYWEISNVVDNQFIAGKNDDSNLSDYNESFGENYSIIASTHMIRIEKPNISEFLR